MNSGSGAGGQNAGRGMQSGRNGDKGEKKIEKTIIASSIKYT